MTEKPVKVIIADDHQLVLDGLQAILSSESSIQVVGTAKNGKVLLELLKTVETDAIMMDVNMPEMDGLVATAKIRETDKDIKILAVSTHDDNRLIRELLKAGANGYVLKSAGQEELKRAVLEVASGKSFFSPEIKEKVMQWFIEGQPSENPQHAMLPISLTPREKEVLKLIAMEYTGKEIAAELHISRNTVDTHRKNLMTKLNVKNSVGLAKYAIKHNLI